jgi:RNA polymerase sigma factor (sigma-70 family)
MESDESRNYTYFLKIIIGRLLPLPEELVYQRDSPQGRAIDDYIESLSLGSERYRIIDRVVATLSEREARVIILRYGLQGGKMHLLQEIGDELGVSRERIRQIEAKTLAKLTHPSRSCEMIPEVSNILRIINVK